VIRTASDVIADLFNIVNEVTLFLAFVLDPLNPLGWRAMFSPTYPLPSFDRECFQKNNSSTWVNTGNAGTPDQYLSCTPGTRVGESSDGYKAQWADTDSGAAPAGILALTFVVRGKREGPSYYDLHTPGTVPHVLITVTTASLYETGAMMALAQSRPPMAGSSPGSLDLEKDKVVKEVRKFRDKYGIEGRRAALTVIAGLAPGQREYLREAVHTLLQRRPKDPRGARLGKGTWIALRPDSFEPWDGRNLYRSGVLTTPHFPGSPSAWTHGDNINVVIVVRQTNRVRSAIPSDADPVAGMDACNASRLDWAEKTKDSVPGDCHH